MIEINVYVEQDKEKSISQIRIPLNWSEANLPHLSSYSIDIHSSVVYVFAFHGVLESSTSVLSKNTYCGV